MAKKVPRIYIYVLWTRRFIFIAWKLCRVQEVNEVVNPFLPVSTNLFCFSCFIGLARTVWAISAVSGACGYVQSEVSVRDPRRANHAFGYRVVKLIFILLFPVTSIHWKFVTTVKKLSIKRKPRCPPTELTTGKSAHLLNWFIKKWGYVNEPPPQNSPEIRSTTHTYVVFSASFS